MRLTLILVVCSALCCSEDSAKPVRIEIEETNKDRRKRLKGDLLNLLHRVSLVRVV
jgi:hypothetical protein